MHSFLSRLNSIVAFGCTTLAALTFFLFCSTLFNQYNANVNIGAVNVFIKNVPDYMVSQTKSDLGIMKLDISADLRPLFNWNARQLFLYLTAEYETKTNKLNQVVLWDKILLRGDNAVLNLKNEPLKYYFWDDGNGLLGHKNVTLYMSWNIIPTAGHLPFWVGTGKQVVKFPTEYTQGRAGF